MRPLNEPDPVENRASARFKALRTSHTDLYCAELWQ